MIVWHAEAGESILLPTTPGVTTFGQRLRQNDAFLVHFFSQSKCSDIIVHQNNLEAKKSKAAVTVLWWDTLVKTWDFKMNTA